MQRFLRIAMMSLACITYLWTTAQTNVCSAEFTYTLGANNQVSFIAKESLGATHRWVWGDGSTPLVSTESQAVHIYAQPGQYQVTHFIEKSSTHCRDSVSKIITIPAQENCQASFEIQKVPNVPPGSSPYIFHFKNTSQPSGAIHSALWKFGDGSTSPDLNPTHSYIRPGAYQVCLHIETIAGCASESCQQLIIDDSLCTLTAKFAHKSEPSDCQKVFFTNESTPISPNTHFIWKFGDGTTSQDINPVHTYTHPGVYYVCLVSESRLHCRAEYCDSVIVRCPSECNLYVRFESKKDSANCRKLYFSNLSSPSNSNSIFKWHFGDGGTSSDKNPSHVYDHTGKYYVCLEVNNGDNCIRTHCDSVAVFCNETCTITARYEYNKDSLDCKKIHFINLSSPIEPNEHFIWKFGDGSISEEINPTHEFVHSGIYFVCLVSESGTTCRKEFCDSVMVGCELTCNLFTRFETKHDSVNWNTVHFRNLSEPVYNIWRTYWYYGDGSSSQDFNSLHTYEKPGIYQVCLKVISLNGCISSYCDSVRLAMPDNCGFKAEFVHHFSPTSPLTLKFEAKYYSNAALYYWNFGDGIGGAGRNVYHVYHKAGKYQVCLTIKERDCATTHCEQVSVGSNCDTIHLRFEYAPKPNRPNEVGFTAICNETLVSQIWHISRVSSNGTVSPPIAVLQQNNPTYLFHDTGWYVVCLKGVSASFCYKEYCERIHIEKVINAPFRVMAYPNPATSTISMEIFLDRADQVFLRILDGSGSLKTEFTKSGTAGNNRFDLPVQGLSQGIYLVEIKSSTRKWLSRFVKG